MKTKVAHYRPVNAGWRCNQTQEEFGIIYDCPQVNRPVGPIAPEHPEAKCQDCGGANVVWHAPSPLWNRVVRERNNGNDIMLCPCCFIIRAEAAGVKPTGWVVQPEVI